MTLTCVDLFCGAGGLSLGLKKAGFQSVMALDSDPDSCRTYKRLAPRAEVLDQSIEGANVSNWKGVDLVAGGPPCQPFSNGGKRLAASDARDMLPKFVRAVNQIKPRAFLLENVAGLMAPRNRAYLQKILSQFDQEYTITPPRIINAADYGVPQKRVRVFIVGVLGGSFEFPRPTHGPGRRRKHVSAGTLVSKEKTIGEENPSKVFYAKTPDLRPSPYAGQLFNGGGRPINLDKPSPTILASAGGNKTHFIDVCDLVPPYHTHLSNGGEPWQGMLDGGRRITVRESALIQTFPEDVEFFGSRSSQYSQIGNAVPPALAAVIGRTLRKLLN